MTKKTRPVKRKISAGMPFENQQKVNALYEQSFAHYQAGLLKEAEESCRAVLATNQHHPDALHLLGMTLHQQGDDLKAIDFIKKAISISPDKFFFHLNLGNIYFSRKNHAEAENCYRQALELNPNFIPTMVHLAQNLEQSQHLQEALGYYKKALAIEPGNPSVLTGLGNALLAGGMLEEAIATLRELVKAAPDSAESYYNLGGALMCFRDMEGAAEQYRKALQLRPDFVDAYYNLGRTEEEALLKPDQPLPETVSFYKRALALNPNHPTALMGLGNALLILGPAEEAIATLRRLVKAAPDRVESYCSLGRALKLSGDLEGAAVSLKQALAIKPEYAVAHNNLGEVLNEQGRVTEAIRCFKEALTCKPDFPETQTRLAIISWLNGDWQDCRYYLDLISNTAQKLTGTETKFVPPFLLFLNKLLKYSEANAARYVKKGNLPILYVVGDSHCLSTANTTMNFRGVDYLTEAKIVLGCKAWHLANKDNNPYKSAFEKTIAAIPGGSPVILMFGEIDCRIDEGIIKHYKKNNVNLTESIIDLVDNYLNYILRIVNSKDIFPVICNVPARLLCKDRASDSDKKLQKKVLAIFNQALANHVTKRQIPLLDVYTLTNTQEGNHDSVCHIDGNHLWPSVFENLIKKL
jgi:superkiller protein 3